MTDDLSSPLTSGFVNSLPLPDHVCYVSGTHILTSEGEKLVEALQVGDSVVTSSGELRPIHWLGHRRLDVRRHPRPREALPVRIAAHAFAPNKPARDLFVSPAHAILVEGSLVPVGRLMNGATIAQVDVEDVTYWHVELDSHDLLIAEGLEAESYLDVGNRDFFVEAEAVRLGASPDATLDEEARAKLPFCRPFVERGPLVEAARARLKARAETLGWRLEASDIQSLRLQVGGQRLAPVVRGKVARFFVPPGAEDLWLVSETSRPCDVKPSADVRDLGFDLRAISFDDGFDEPLAIALDDPRLRVGFHRPEDGKRRWTSRRALLPGELFADRRDGGFLKLELGVASPQRWRSPVAEPAKAAS